MPPERRSGFQHVSNRDRRVIRSLHHNLRGHGAEHAITEAFNIDRSTLYRIAREPDEPVPSSVSQLRSRSLLSTENQELFASFMEERAPIYKKELPDIVDQLFGIDVSAETAHRYLVRQGLKRYSTMVGPNINAEDRPARVESAQEIFRHIDSTLFIDEAKLGHLHLRPPKYYGTRPGLFYEAAFPRGLSSNVVGAVHFGGTLPLQIPARKNVTASSFAKFWIPSWDAYQAIQGCDML